MKNQKIHSPIDSKTQDVDIVYEDRILLIANKPGGVPSTEPAKNKIPNFFDQVKSFIQFRDTKGGLHKKEIYLSIQHRLDQDTSGLLLFCKKKSMNKAISDLFLFKKIQKTYLAVVKDSEKKLNPTQFPLQLKNFIGRSQEEAMKMQCFDQAGPERQEAETMFEWLGTSKKDPTLHLIMALPKTGRTHQIRAHLLSLNLPVLGDPFYGGMALPMYLHAWKLEFEHPESHSLLNIKGDFPPYFKQFLEEYFGDLGPL